MDVSFPVSLLAVVVFVLWLICEIRKGPLLFRLLLPIPLFGVCAFVSCALAGIGNFSRNVQERTAIKNLVDGVIAEIDSDQPNDDLSDALHELNDNLVITYDGRSNYEAQVKHFLQRIERPYVSTKELFDRRQK